MINRINKILLLLGLTASFSVLSGDPNWPSPDRADVTEVGLKHTKEENMSRERFAAAMRSAVTESSELGYAPTRILQMLESGTHAVDIAKKLVVSGDFQTGFREMIARGRPDLTFESIMLEDEFADLFTRQELEVARWRLSNVKN